LLVVVALMAWLGPTAAHAAAPSNDLWENAFAINSPSSAFVTGVFIGGTTVESTYSPIYWQSGPESDVDLVCPSEFGDTNIGGPVWYEGYASSPGRLRLSVHSSAFDPVLFLFRFDHGTDQAVDADPGTPGNQFVACSLPDTLEMYVTPGAYKFAVAAYRAFGNPAPEGTFEIGIDSFRPDGDGDTVVDDEDQCPAVAGSASHGGCAPPPDEPAPPPAPGDPTPAPVDLGPNTCPAGITPPTGEFPSISINGGAVATKGAQVTVGLSWPSGTTEVLLSNDNGGPYQAFPPSRCIGWQLDAGLPGREARVVYARFRNSAGAITASESDNIILDTTRPKVIAGGGRAPDGRFSVAIRATDAESGVARLDVLDRRRRVIESVRVCRRSQSRCDRTVSRSVTVGTRRPVQIRAVDAAGNERVTPFQFRPCKGSDWKGKWVVKNGRLVCVRKKRG
jgi:hypothetical protein